MWHVSSTNDVIFSFTLKKAKKNGAGEGNRTLATSLEGWGSTIELHPQNKKMVGAAGFEPATPWSQARCATKLRYAPPTKNIIQDMA